MGVLRRGTIAEKQTHGSIFKRRNGNSSIGTKADNVNITMDDGSRSMIDIVDRQILCTRFQVSMDQYVQYVTTTLVYSEEFLRSTMLEPRHLCNQDTSLIDKILRRVSKK
jgi:hypothetical protein